MNLTKEAALQSEDIRDYAEDVATVAGVGRRCEMHEGSSVNLPTKTS